MSELPSIKRIDRTAPKQNRASSVRESVSQTARQPLTYSNHKHISVKGERFHYITKIVNYDQMTDGAVWKEYEKLRDCLKTLNEEILFQMEKKAYANRKSPVNEPGKDVAQQVQVLEEQRKTNETKIKSHKQHLAALEYRCKKLDREGIREQLEQECEQIAQTIKTYKTENKDIKRKTKLLSRDLVTAPQQLLDKLLNLEEQLNNAQRKLTKQKREMQVSQKLINSSIDKFNEVCRAINTRMEQYKEAERGVEEEINLENYRDLTAARDNIRKYQSPLKKNYLVKLRELDTLVTSVSRHDRMVQEAQHNIMIFRAEIESIGQIINSRRSNVGTVRKMEVKPMRYNSSSKEQGNRMRGQSMMELREQNDKMAQVSTALQ